MCQEVGNGWYRELLIRCESLFSTVGWGLLLIIHTIYWTLDKPLWHDFGLGLAPLCQLIVAEMKGKARGRCNGTTHSVSGLISTSAKHCGAFLGVRWGHFNFLFFPLYSFYFFNLQNKGFGLHLWFFKCFSAVDTFLFPKWKLIWTLSIFIEKSRVALEIQGPGLCCLRYLYVEAIVLKWSDTASQVQDDVNLGAVQMFS